MTLLLKDKGDKRDALECKLQENADHAANTIKLNVGGKIFCISQVPPAQSSSIGSPRATARTSSPRTNPKQFDRVLDYLRTGELSLKGLRPDQSHQLKTTLDNLQIGFDARGPIPEATPASWDPRMCGVGLNLFQRKRVIRSLWKSLRSVDPCVRYSVRLNSSGGNVFVCR